MIPDMPSNLTFAIGDRFPFTTLKGVKDDFLIR